MNCIDCRRHLHPYLDSEIDVRDNLTILDHLNCCEGCRDIFETEERSMKRAREILRKDRAPSALAEAVPAWLERADRRLFFSRASWSLLPLAAAGVILSVVYWPLPDPPVEPRPLPGSVPAVAHIHGYRDHGGGIEFAYDHFFGLESAAEAAERPVLDPAILKEHSENYEELDGARLQEFYRQLFGDGSKLPPELVAPRIQGAALSVSFRGTPVSNLTLDLQDRKIGVYRLKKEDAVLADMKLIDDGVTTGLKIERCRGCFVIAVTRGDVVYILVSKEGVEPLIQMVRQTF